ncbi:TetR/AcrR family transcriptional regulator [Sphaerisporangium sp. NPDC005288]|uniref:TetR/AcrR family transcriptional regulator n=1 Tax=Sphaerisporangium sp. NPDC005288 TaxID=3155114 RepID=UPI0033B1727C
MAQRGRPLGYEPDKVLDVAMRLFWAHGYEGTSMSDLTEAMGINRRSLYAAYGSKEGLFEAALARYVDGPGAFPHAAVEKPTAYEVAECYLRQAVLSYTCPELPRGCMTVQAGLTCSAEAEPVRDELASKRRLGIELLTKRLVRAAEEGDLPAGADPSALAGYLVALNHGFSVQAGGGITRMVLMRFVDQALLLWPGRPS